jgi:hypothetical protein
MARGRKPGIRTAIMYKNKCWLCGHDVIRLHELIVIKELALAGVTCRIEISRMILQMRKGGE